MSEVLAGTGWEIYRNLVDAEIAQTAGQQALQLIASSSKYIVEQSTLAPGVEGLDIYRLHAWHPGTYPQHLDTIQADPKEVANNQELIDVHRRFSKYVSKYVSTCFINVYQPSGHTRRHRDRSSEETLAVGLLGNAEARITDPVTNKTHVFEINPGDAMHLHNPHRITRRPLHIVTNTSETDLRVSLVE